MPKNEAITFEHRNLEIILQKSVDDCPDGRNNLRRLTVDHEVDKFCFLHLRGLWQLPAISLQALLWTSFSAVIIAASPFSCRS